MFTANEKVVCIHTFQDQGDAQYGVVHPVKREMYTIRTISVVNGLVYLRFHELKNPVLNYATGPDECQYWDERFRKLDYQFAEDVIANIKEQVNTE